MFNTGPEHSVRIKPVKVVHSCLLLFCSFHHIFYSYYYSCCSNFNIQLFLSFQQLDRRNFIARDSIVITAHYNILLHQTCVKRKTNIFSSCSCIYLFSNQSFDFSNLKLLSMRTFHSACSSFILGINFIAVHMCTH